MPGCLCVPRLRTGILSRSVKSVFSFQGIFSIILCNYATMDERRCMLSVIIPAFNEEAMIAAAAALLPAAAGAVLRLRWDFTGGMLAGLCGAAGRLLGAPFSRLLGLSDDGAGVFFLGLIGGYPSGAVSAGELYSKGAISRDEAERLISFTNNATPAFAAGFCGSVLGDARCGALLYSVCIVSSVVWGVMIRKKAGKREKSKLRLSVPRLSSAVLSASSSCVVICADVIVFSIISGALSRLPLGFVIPALFEVTGGAVSLAAHVRDLRLCGSAVCALVSFSGLCVADQTDGVCRGYGLSPGYYLAGKPVQAVLSFLLYYLSYPLIIS